MVRAIIFPIALLSSAPAVAQSDEVGTRAAVERLSDPATADAIASMAEALTRAVTAMPVGEIAAAMRQINPDSRIADLPADATVGDLARGDSLNPERIGDDAHAAATMAGTMSRQMTTMIPVFAAMARDLAAQWSAQWDAARRTSRRR